jgi:hypothetical protein
VTIEIEAPDTIHAGEVITGVVHASERVRVCVRRKANWRSSRGSAPATKDQEPVVLEAGGPFTLPAVRGPLTHAGEHAELRWTIVAESFSGRDRVERPFTLVAPLTTTYEREAAGGYRDPPTETRTLEPELGENHAEGLRRRATVAEDPIAIVGARVARFFNTITGVRAGVRDVVLAVTPSRVRAGDEIVAKLSFTTTEETVVESITIQLSAREHWETTRVESEPIIESGVQTFSERARLAPGPWSYEARMKVPDDATPSWAVDYFGPMGVRWFVRAIIQIDGLVDDVTDFLIAVAPF